MEPVRDDRRSVTAPWPHNGSSTCARLLREEVMIAIGALF